MPLAGVRRRSSDGRSYLLAGESEPSNERQSLLVRLVDELHETATISDELWGGLEKGWGLAQIIELIALAGQHYAVSFLVNGL